MVTEQALTFACGGHTLLGVLSLPERPASDIGVLIVVGGPQYRVGSHRQFALLARHLAAAGVPALRFDIRGMGDSEGEARDFLAIDDDIAAAIAAFEGSCPSLRRTVLWGLCDAASAALLYWHRRRDPRVAGLALLNPWVRSEAGLARTRVRHYYRERLLQKAFWAKLLRGHFAPWQALRDGVRNLRLARGASVRGAGPAFQDDMAQALAEFPGPLLCILSGRDLTGQEFADWAAARFASADWHQRRGWQHHTLAGADHTFASALWRAEVERLTEQWLQAMPAN